MKFESIKDEIIINAIVLKLCKNEIMTFSELFLYIIGMKGKNEKLGYIITESKVKRILAFFGLEFESFSLNLYEEEIDTGSILEYIQKLKAKGKTPSREIIRLLYVLLSEGRINNSMLLEQIKKLQFEEIHERMIRDFYSSNF